MLDLAQWFVMAVAFGTVLSSNEIFTKVAENNIGRQELSYVGLREYRLRNTRVAKEIRFGASVTATVVTVTATVRVQ
jgi:hypothetical protein